MPIAMDFWIVRSSLFPDAADASVALADAEVSCEAAVEVLEATLAAAEEVTVLPETMTTEVTVGRGAAVLDGLVTVVESETVKAAVSDKMIEGAALDTELRI